MTGLTIMGLHFLREVLEYGLPVHIFGILGWRTIKTSRNLKNTLVKVKYICPKEVIKMGSIIIGLYVDYTERSVAHTQQKLAQVALQVLERAFHQKSDKL